MKKRYLAVPAMALLFGLAACNSTNSNDPNQTVEKDTNGPVFSGVQNQLTTEQNKEINLLTGITAVDAKDGDVTANIKVTTMPSLTVTNGCVSPTDTGDYEVTYEAKDSDGNVVKAFTTLTVTKALAEKKEYMKFSFADKDEQGFNYFIFSEAGSTIVGTKEIKNGNYVLNVTTSDNEAWHIKFEKTFDTEVGVDYEISYTFTSTIAGIVKPFGEKEVEIVKGSNTVTHKFTASEATKYTELQFGMLEGPYVITMSEVVLKKSVGQDVYNQINANHTFNDQNATAIFDNNSSGSVTCTNNQAVLNINRGSDENNLWQTKFVLKSGLDLEANKKYRISVDVKGLYDQTDIEVLFNNGDVEKGIGALYGQTLVAGEVKTFSFTTTLEAAKDNMNIVLQCGKLAIPQGSQTITISNLVVEEVTGDKIVTETKYTFAPDGFGTYNDANEAEGYLYVENGKLVYDMKKLAVTDWHNKMFIDKLTLAEGKIYTIEFKAKADKEISCAFFLNVRTKWDPRLSEVVKFTTEEQTFSYTVPNAFATEMDFEILWQFGSEDNKKLGNAKIEISEIIIYSQDVE